MSLTGPRKRRETFVSGRKEKEKRGKKKEIAGQVAGLRSTVRHRGERIVDGRTARATRNLARRHYSSRVPSSNGTESNCVGGLEKKNLTELVKRTLQNRPVPPPVPAPSTSRSSPDSVSHAHSAFRLSHSLPLQGIIA